MQLKTLQEIATHIKPITLDEIKSEYFFQTGTWAQIKKGFDWEACAFRQNFFLDLAQDILILVRKVANGCYIAYVPDGILPHKVVEDSDCFANNGRKQELEAQVHHAFMLLASLTQVLLESRKRSVFCIRWDVPWIVHATKREDVSLELFDSYRLSFQQWYKYISLSCRPTTQPPASIVLDIDKPIEEILSTMKSKTRYNIKLAIKKGVTVEDIDVSHFYELYRTTSERNKIAIHSKEYYLKVYNEISLSKDSDVHIYGAKLQDVLIAGIFVVYYNRPDGKKDAMYLYGASANEYRNYMPTYALQWHAIQSAVHANCHSYDMFGVPLTQDNTHRMQGLYRFKTGFGGEFRYRMAGYEIFIKNGKNFFVRWCQYKLFILVEMLRMWYYYIYKK